MSLVFSDTSTYKGLVQIYEKECGFNRGEISGNTDKLKELTADINLALDDFLSIALRHSGTWQFDDSNQTDYPIITTNLVSGQRDYSFTTDGSGNLILDIYRVTVLPSASATEYVDILPVDAQSDSNVGGLVSNNTTGGTPSKYDKTANGIFLDPIPNYNATAGLRLYVNRESTYFTYTDTSKKAGIPGIFHRYLAIKPALDYARANSLANYNRLKDEVDSYEGDEARRLQGSIAIYFSERPRDERRRMTVASEDNR